MTLIPVGNNIAFTFVDRVNSKGEFEPPPTESGILLQSSFDDSAKQPRWGNVVAVGARCTTIKPGMQILLPNLRWTSHFTVGGQKVWRTDETQVAAYRATPTSQVHPMTTYVLFKKIVKEFVRPTTLIIVVGGTNDETPSGTVFAVGPDATPDLKSGQVLYYSDTNFTDTFVHAGITMSFIKDENILAIDNNGV
jgi:co-chaperonin GroES (HSP10)